MTGLANNCFCKSSATCALSYGFGGYMDFESFSFYREHFGVSPYYTVATFVGTVIPTIVSVIVLNWWRYKDLWMYRQENRVWSLSTSKDEDVMDLNNAPGISEDRCLDNTAPAPDFSMLDNHDVAARKAHIPKGQVGYTISFTRHLGRVVQDSIKRGIECVAGCPLSWWPLSDLENRLRPGYTRVYATLQTVASQQVLHFYDDIPTQLAELLFPALIDSRRRAWRSTWPALNQEAVHLFGTTMTRLLHQHAADSSAQHQATQSSEFATTLAKGDGRRHSTARELEGDRQTHGLQQDHIEEHRTSATTKWSQKPGEQPIIFLTIDTNPNSSMACSVEIGMDDQTTFQNLRSAHRGLARWAWKRATGIQFYRVITVLLLAFTPHNILTWGSVPLVREFPLQSSHPAS